MGWKRRGMGFGGSAGESNPPRTLVTPYTGFEDQASHQTRRASRVSETGAKIAHWSAAINRAEADGADRYLSGSFAQMAVPNDRYLLLDFKQWGSSAFQALQSESLLQ